MKNAYQEVFITADVIRFMQCKLSQENDIRRKVNYFPEKAFSIKIFMETGFNIVEVPGSKNRKVAEKKQPWYRTANWKMFIFFYNSIVISFLGYNFFFNYNILQKLYPFGPYNPFAPNGNTIIRKVSNTASVFNSELHKIGRNIFSGFTAVSVKFNSAFFSFIESIHFSVIHVSAGKESDTLKKQIKWLSI